MLYFFYGDHVTYKGDFQRAINCMAEIEDDNVYN